MNSEQRRKPSSFSFFTTNSRENSSKKNILKRVSTTYYLLSTIYKFFIVEQVLPTIPDFRLKQHVQGFHNKVLCVARYRLFSKASLLYHLMV